MPSSRRLTFASRRFTFATTSERLVHWLAPFSIIGSLVVGVLFALGHHFFYASLNGKIASNAGIDFLGTNISDQQFNITAGTVFANLVNFCLGTAVTTAYVQVFWRRLLRDKATLETWDSAFAATKNVFYLGKIKIWYHLPLIYGLVIIAWLLPLASNIPPGTLSVDSAPVQSPPIVRTQVPNVDFVSLNYVGSMPRAEQGEDSQQDSQFNYQGPSTDVSRIASQVAQTGVILPITPPGGFSNASWTLEFAGPRLKCALVDSASAKTVQDTLKKSTVENGVCDLQGYMSWNNDQTFPLPNNASLSLKDVGNGGLAINLAAYPHMLDVIPGTEGSDLQYIPYTKACYSNAYNGLDNPERFADSTVMQCRLQNATYHLDFRYVDGNQTIKIDTEMISEDPINSVAYVRGLGTQYQSEVIKNHVDCSILSGWTSNPNPNNLCRIDTDQLKTLSYQSIFDAFSTLVNGSVTRGLVDTSPKVKTSVESTVLVETTELQFLTLPSASYPALVSKPLQEYIRVGQLPLFRGLVNDGPALRFQDLALTIENLFQNITVSMMSSRTLQPNENSNFIPQPVNVQLENFHNVYVYAAGRLWIAYGIAILCAAIPAAVGIWAIHANGVSYSDDFSTIFRLGRGASMSDEVRPEDFDGKDPLPKYLKSAKVWLKPLETQEKESKDQIQEGNEEGSEEEDEQNELSPLSPNTVERTAGDQTIIR